MGRDDHRWVLVALALCLCVRSSAVAGVLAEAQSYAVDGSPVGVVPARIAGNDGVDLVICSDDGDKGPSASLLSGHVRAIVTAEKRVAVDPGRYIAHAAAAADFNGDGAADFAVAVSVADVSPVRGGVLVYLSTKNGGFAEPQLYTLAGVYPTCLEAADVTGDGTVDLIACDSTGDASGGGLVSVLPGASDGSFGSETAIKVGSLPTRAVVADVDGDQRIDVVLADTVDDQVIVLYGNHGPTIFDAPVNIGSVDDLSALSVVRTMSGSLLDVAATSNATPQILLFHQVTARAFQAPVASMLDDAVADLGSADFDGDGRDDLVVLSQAGTRLALLAGQGDGHFAPLDSVTLDDAATRLAVVDLDLDGKPDVALTSTDTDNLVVVANVYVATPTPTPTATGGSATTYTPMPGVTPSPTPIGSGGTPTPTPLPTPLATPTADITASDPGDANCDGVIDETDVPALIHRLFDENGCSGADVDGDGQVTAADLVALLQSLWEQQ